MKIKRSKNKKGDIPVMILVFGVLIVCVSALISFSVSDNKIKKSFTGVTLVEELNTEIEKYYFYKNTGFSEEEISKIMGINWDITGAEYISVEKFSKDGDKIISVLYYLP